MSCSPGMTISEVVVEEIHNCHGQHYFKATATIGSVFGAEVEGSELIGIGRTRELAMERFERAFREAYESLWY